MSTTDTERDGKSVLPLYLRWYIGIALFCFLTGLLVIVGRQIRRTVATRQTANCAANLHRLGQAMLLYVADNDGYWPLDSTWKEARFSSETLPGCPATQAMANYPGLKQDDRTPPGYAYNLSLTLFPTLSRPGESKSRHTSTIAFPATTVAVCEAARGFPLLGNPNPYRYGATPQGIEEGWKRHGGGSHYLFCDGHVRGLTADAIRMGEDEHDGNDGVQPSFMLVAPRPHRYP